MANIGKLNVVLVASTGPFGKSMKTAQRITERFAGHAKKFGASIGNIMQSMWKRAAIFAGLISGALIYGLKKAADSIDDVTKASRRLLGGDGATGALAGLRLSASLAGVEAAALDKGLEKMLETISKAGEGDMAAVEALERIGVTAEQLKKLTPEKRLEAVAAGIQKIGDAGDRITAARGIFGRAGGGLLSLFEGGAEAISDATREAELFGLSVSAKAAGAVEKMNDNFTRLSAVVEGVFIQAVSRIAPIMNGITDAMLEQIDAAGGVGQAVETAFNFILDKTVNTLNAMGDLWDSAMRLQDAFTGFDFGGFGGLGEIAENAYKAVDKVVEKFLQLKSLMLKVLAIRDAALAVVTGSEGRAQKKAQDKALAGINPKHREQARKILEENPQMRPGVGQETFGIKARAKFDEAAATDKKIAENKIKIEERERKKREGTNVGLGDKFKKFVYDAKTKADEQAAKIPDMLDAAGAGASAKGSNITAQGGSAKLVAFNGPTFTKDNIPKQTLDVLRTIAKNTENRSAVLA